MNRKCPNVSASTLNVGNKRKGNDGNMWVVAKRSNGKYWKKNLKQQGGVRCGNTVTGYNDQQRPLYQCNNHNYGSQVFAGSQGCTRTYYQPCINICDNNNRQCSHYRVITEVSHNWVFAGQNRNGTTYYQCANCGSQKSE